MAPNKGTPHLESLDQISIDLFGPEVGKGFVGLLRELIRLVQADHIVDWKEVLKQTSLSRKTIQRLMEDGSFPARIQLSESRSGWRRSEIEAWIRSRQIITGYRSSAAVEPTTEA